MGEKLPETINFPSEELKILELWKKLDVFQTSLRQSKGKPRYSFYDGPPFATGLPHYGHLLTGTIKDIITRYAHQSGYHVDRRFGWDTHGLPVEYEIDNALGLKGPEDVMKLGISNYNMECRKIVMRYADEWEIIVNRLGRWIDFKNDYKTLYPWYMESIWWVFKELYNKGLVYQGVKVMPYSTGCNTPLSNFESGQNYKEVIDPSVIVAFPLTDQPEVALLAWTTTPWTLPSNLALCCNPDFTYVILREISSNNKYIILEKSIEMIWKTEDLYAIESSIKGSQLKGKSYQPPFSYYEKIRENGGFRILNDPYVTSETGTGIVHQAPYFGEDDYRCCLLAGIITKDQEPVCPVDSCGRFTQPINDFIGTYVKNADKDIIKDLEKRGKLVWSGQTKHSYPYCWRSDTPLIYKAVPSWFVRVESFKDKLLAASADTYWVPDYVKEKRFGNWLRDARDWAISRNRYWGNPMPIWISDDKQEIVCVGSIAELEELTGHKITDIHRENIDNLEIPSKRLGHPPLKRVSEVFDCWFESGSMPYAQVHYPFEKPKEFDDCFPADFIAEGIDQTRGWFYTLLVISTALYGKAPFKNLVCNGLILAADGQKMSKRKKNYPDPIEIIDKFGADALRLYLINSPVVRAENLRFKEDGVRDIIKDVFLPWYNAFRFLIQNIERYERDENIKFVYDDTIDTNRSNNIMDKWIISFTQTLLQFLKKEMNAYRLYTVVPRLLKFITNLTNWYVRMNRKRIKGENGKEDCGHALNTLFSVVYTMARINAPFTPFLSEFMFQRLSKLIKESTENMDSVHYQMIPEARDQLIDEDIERAVTNMQTIIDLGRIVRDRKTIPVKYPLPEIVVIHQDPEILREIVNLESYIIEELNVKKLTVTTDKEKYGVTLRAEPDHKILGARLKGQFKAVTQAIKELTDKELQEFIVNKEISVAGHKLEEQDIRIMFNFTGPKAQQLSLRYEAHSDNNVLILLDVTPDDSMQDEGIAREIINRVQKLRKKGQLVPSDDADVYYEIKDDQSSLARVIIDYKDFIENTTKTPQKSIKDLNKSADVIIEEMQKVKGVDMKLVLVKKGNKKIVETKKLSYPPIVDYVNIELIDLQPRYGANGTIGTILIKTPMNDKFITLERLKREIDVIFGIYGCHYELWNDNTIIDSDNDVEKLHKQLIYVVKNGSKIPEEKKIYDNPACNFIDSIDVKKQLGFTILCENPKGDHQLSIKKQHDVFDTFFRAF